MERTKYDISEILLQLYEYDDNMTNNIIDSLNNDEIEDVHQKALSVGNDKLENAWPKMGYSASSEIVRPFKKNLPVSELIKQFNEKGKRSKAATQLKERFLNLDYEDQRKVFELFLDESESYRKWCYNTLLRWRDRSFDDKLIEKWKRFHDSGCAWAMLCLFEAEKLQSVAHDIQNYSRNGLFAHRYSHDKSYRYYYMLCWKMASQKDFTIDWDYLRENCDADHYLKLANRAGFAESEETCRRLLYHQVLSLMESIASNNKYLEDMHKRESGLYANYKEIIKSTKSYIDEPFSAPRYNSLFLISNVTTIKTSLREIYKMGHHSLVLSYYQWELQNSNKFVCALEKNSKDITEEKENQLFAEHTIKSIPLNFEDIDAFDISCYKGLRDSAYYKEQKDKRFNSGSLPWSEDDDPFGSSSWPEDQKNDVPF